MTQWADQIDGAKLSVLPPALIGILVAYAKWKRQNGAVKFGGFAIIVMALFVAVHAVPILNLSTFVLVLFCILVTSSVGVRHIPWRKRSDKGMIFFYAGAVFSAVLLLMLETLTPDQTPRSVIWVLLGLIGAAFFISPIFFVLDNMKGTLLFALCAVLVSLMLMGLWWIVTLVGLDKSHPVIAEVIVYVALLLVLPVVMFVALMLKEEVSVEPNRPTA